MTASAAFTTALLLGDARLPAGGHAHSGGMEPALLGGMPVALAEEFLRSRTRTTALVDAATAVVTRHAIVAGEDAAGIEQEWVARTPASALREASRLLARGLLRVAPVFAPDVRVLAAWAKRPVPPPRPLVLGAIAAGCGMDAATLARVSVYDDVQAGAAAVLKLEPRDPVALTALVHRLCAEVDPLLVEVARLTEASGIPAFSTPQFESWAEDHARSNRRLFRA